MKTFLKYFSVWYPTVLGALFPLVVKINHWSFQAGNSDARDAIGVELLYLGLTFFAVCAELPVLIFWIVKKKWWLIPQAIISVVLYFLLVYVGIECGAAILYAT